MRSASAALIEYLRSGKSFLMADLLTFTLIGGYQARYTNADYDIEYGGNTFLHNEIQFSRTSTKIVLGTDIDNLTINVTAKPENLLNGSSWLSAVKNGALDGATVLLERVFMPTLNDTSLGAITLFCGAISEAQAGRFQAELVASSDLQFLNIKMPREVFQPGCKNSLYGNGCTLSQPDWASQGYVLSASKSSININLPTIAGYFSLGIIEFTSGLNAGITRSIKNHTFQNLQLALPLVVAPAYGDTFDIFPGCDKTLETCQEKFNNRLNFRGEPFVPVPETAT